MNPVEIILVTGVMTGIMFAAALVVGFAVVKTSRFLKAVDADMAGLAKGSAELVKAINALHARVGEHLKYTSQIAQELAYMRTATMAAMPQGDGTGGNQAYRPPQYAPSPFPPIDWDKIPDAEPEDTPISLLNQTDDDLVALDRLEELRKLGVDVREETEDQPGFTTESE